MRRVFYPLVQCVNISPNIAHFISFNPLVCRLIGHAGYGIGTILDVEFRDRVSHGHYYRALKIVCLYFLPFSQATLDSSN